MKILLLVCTLLGAMYLYPSDGASFTRKLGNCPKNGYKMVVFRCNKKCIIRSATVRFKKGGNVNLVGRDGRRLFTPLLCGRKCFCRGFKGGKRNFEKCFKKKGHRIRKGIVSFVMKCKKFTRNVRFYINGNIRSQKAIKPEVLLVRRMKIGKMHPNQRKYFMARCKRPCNVKNIHAKFIGGNVDLYASKIQRNLADCMESKCICVGSSQSSSNETCVMKDIESSNTFYIMLEALKEANDVTLYYKIGQFLIINPISSVLTWKLGDLEKDKPKYFKIRCNGTCDLKAPYITYNREGAVNMHWSESTIRGDINDCQSKCLCSGSARDPKYTPCRLKRKATKDTIHLHLDPEKISHNVTLDHRIDNLFSIEPFLPECGCDKPNMNGNCDIKGKCFCNSGYTNDQGDNQCR